MTSPPLTERQADIADAALRILSTKGLGALTVAALAKEVGVTGGALYRHFPSTEAILGAVAQRAASVLLASLPEPELPPLEWLERFMHARARTVAGHTGLIRLLFSDQLLLALPADAVEVLRGLVRATAAAITRALVAGQERGEIRSDVDAKDLVPIVMGAVQMMAMQQAGTLMSRVGQPQRAWLTLATLLAPPKGVSR